MNDFNELHKKYITRSSIDKRFYEKLPSMCCEVLDGLIDKYSDRVWFKKAWNEYKEHVNKSTLDTLRMPGYIFNKYIEEDKKNGWKNYLEKYDSEDLSSNYLAHHGIKGQKWGIRRWQNEDGSLTEAGRKHYERADERWTKWNSDRIYNKAMKESKREMKKYVNTELKGYSGRTAMNMFNQKLAQVMRTKTKDIRTPSGKVVEWVAKRGEVGVYMALADAGYDMDKLKRGVWAGGRISYKKETVEMK